MACYAIRSPGMKSAWDVLLSAGAHQSLNLLDLFSTASSFINTRSSLYFCFHDQNLNSLVKNEDFCTTCFSLTCRPPREYEWHTQKKNIWRSNTSSGDVFTFPMPISGVDSLERWEARQEWRMGSSWQCGKETCRVRSLRVCQNQPVRNDWLIRQVCWALTELRVFIFSKEQMAMCNLKKDCSTQTTENHQSLF